MSEPRPLFPHTPPWSTHRELHLFSRITYINNETKFPAATVLVYHPNPYHFHNHSHD